MHSLSPSSHRYSAGACYKQCDTQLIEGNMADSFDYRPPFQNSSSGAGQVWSVRPCPDEAWCAAHGFPSAIDGRYVDGISITYGDPYSVGDPKMRKHVWTYAVGNSQGFAENMQPNSAAAIPESDFLKFKAAFPWYDANSSDKGVNINCVDGTCTLPGVKFGPIAPFPNGTKTPAAIFQDMVVYRNCWSNPTTTNIAVCYVGNCECHGGAELRADLFNPPNAAGQRLGADAVEKKFGAPNFLGSDWYCDGGSGKIAACTQHTRMFSHCRTHDQYNHLPTNIICFAQLTPFTGAVDQYRYANAFKSHKMFTTTDTCVGQGGGSGDRKKKRGKEWWAKQGGPGHFVKSLDEVTNEVR